MHAGCVDGWVDGAMVGWIDRRMDGWMVGWMVGSTLRVCENTWKSSPWGKNHLQTLLKLVAISPRQTKTPCSAHYLSFNLSSDSSAARDSQARGVRDWWMRSSWENPPFLSASGSLKSAPAEQRGTSAFHWSLGFSIFTINSTYCRHATSFTFFFFFFTCLPLPEYRLGTKNGPILFTHLALVLGEFLLNIQCLINICWNEKTVTFMNKMQES